MKYDSSLRHNRWCTGRCNACHANHRCYYLREYSGCCFCSRYVFDSWLQIGRPLHVLLNIMLMRIYDVPIGSKVSVTTFWDNLLFLRKVHEPTKLGVRTEGPYTIECAHVNSNLTIILCEGITESINICRVLPYCWTIPHTLVKTILSMDCIKVFTFYLWSFFLHLTFELVVGGVFLGPASVLRLWQSKSHHGGEECCAHGNNFYGYGGRVQK